MRHALAFALALFVTAAHADGVPLLTAKGVNRHALDAKIITVKIEGKEHQFIGGPRNSGTPGADGWAGFSTNGHAGFTRTKEGVTGEIQAGNKLYRLNKGKLTEVIFKPTGAASYEDFPPGKDPREKK